MFVTAHAQVTVSFIIRCICVYTRNENAMIALVFAGIAQETFGCKSRRDCMSSDEDGEAYGH
jgi:hypothetical protein